MANANDTPDPAAGHPALTDANCIVASQEHVFCELEGNAVILSLADGKYYGLDPVGLRIWELVQQATPFADLLRTLTEEYEVEPEQCRQDVTALLHDLASKGLVRWT